MNLKDPSTPVSVHSKSLSGGLSDIITHRAVSAPYLSIIEEGSITFCFDLLIFSTLPTFTFLLLFMPVIIGLALAERVNQFKKEALEKQKTLNEELEVRVQQRTLELTEANQLITQSINTASNI